MAESPMSMLLSSPSFLGQVTSDASSKILLDLLVIVGVVAGVVVAIIETIRFIREWRDLRSQLNEFFTPEEIRNAQRCYVRPHCSEEDLSQKDELQDSSATKDALTVSSRMDLFNKIDRFMRDGIVASSRGRVEHHHMLLLADSGMGKTSFLLNYYLSNNRRFWNRRRIAVIPLGDREALTKLQGIYKKKKTVLFLDAFDEDPEAVKNYRARLDALMVESEKFLRVLITARTQFFPRDDEIPSQAPIVTFGPHRPGGPTREFAKLYLAPFSKQQVDEFLHDRYGFFYRWPRERDETLKTKVNRLFRRYRFLWRIQQREKARAVVENIRPLSIRPLLLTYIPDVLEKASQIKHSYELFELAVDYWYDVEVVSWGSKESIRRFSEEIAVESYQSFLKAGAYLMRREDVVELARSLQIRVEDWKTTARSLLIRDAQGNYKFAHRAIMEHLFVKKFVEGDERCSGIQWTDQMKKFMVERIVSDQESEAPLMRDLRGADLADAVFDLRSLKGLSLPNSNLKKVKFSQGCDLEGASFCESNLEKASIYKAKLTGANLSKAILRKADFRFADLTRANLEFADLEGADLEWANLAEAVVRGANLQGCDLQGAKCKGVDLEKANLRGAKLGGWGETGADLREASLKDADLTDAVISGAKMQGANLSGCIVTWEQIVSAQIDGHTLVDQTFLQRKEAWLNGLLSRNYRGEVKAALHGISDGSRPASDLSVTYREEPDGIQFRVSRAGRWELHKKSTDYWDFPQGPVDSQRVRELVTILLDLGLWEHNRPGWPHRYEPHATLTIEVGNLEVRFWEYDDLTKNGWLIQIRDRIFELFEVT